MTGKITFYGKSKISSEGLDPDVEYAAEITLRAKDADEASYLAVIYDDILSAFRNGTFHVPAMISKTKTKRRQ